MQNTIEQIEKLSEHQNLLINHGLSSLTLNSDNSLTAVDVMGDVFDFCGFEEFEQWVKKEGGVF